MRNLQLFLFLIITGIKLNAQPIITSINPQFSAKVGESITIYGTNFSPIPTNNSVYFGAVKGEVTTASATALTVIVPQGSKYAYLCVTTLNKTAYSPQPFCPSYNGNGILNSGLFNNRIDIATPNYPRYLITKDLDNDNRPDLTVVNNQSNSLSVFKNQSQSGVFTLSPKIDYATGAIPMQATSDDLDGDGKPELLVCNHATAANSIYIYRNLSNGGNIDFETPLSLATNPNPKFTVVADMNSDGKPDIVVVNTNGYNVSIFTNQSSPGILSFSSSVSFPLGSWPQALAVGDIDGDDKPDILVADPTDNTVSLLLNQSSGLSISFAARVIYATNLSPHTVAVGDLDYDGKTDIIIGNTNSNNISIYKNASTPGAINLEPKIDIQTGSGPYDITLGDLDGDSRPELVTANFYAGTASILKNLSTPGTINFAPKVDFATGTGPRSVSICDYDGNGLPDLAVANSTANTMTIWRFQNSTTPLILGGINAIGSNNNALISWNTISEINTSHFIIQHSVNGSDFFDIGLINASGNSTLPQDYRFIHEFPVGGKNYYRLKMYDRDLSYTTSIIVMVNFISEGQLKLFSNPSKLNAVVYHPESKNAIIYVNDLSGRNLKKIVVPNSIKQTSIDISGFIPGIYFIHWFDNGQKLNTRLIVQ